MGIHPGNLSSKYCERGALVTLQYRIYFDTRHVMLTVMHAFHTPIMLNLVGIYNQSLVNYNISF